MYSKISSEMISVNQPWCSLHRQNSHTLKEHQKFRHLWGFLQVSGWGFTIVVHEKICLEAYINNQYIWLIDNPAQLYFILGRTNVHCNFTAPLRDAPDIQRFPTAHMVKNPLPVGKFVNIRAILRYSGKCPCRSALINVKYNCAVDLLFLFIWLVVYECFQIYFLLAIHCKTSIRKLWSSRKSLLAFVINSHI